jgi:hypothetical protein
LRNSLDKFLIDRAEKSLAFHFARDFDEKIWRPLGCRNDKKLEDGFPPTNSGNE